MSVSDPSATINYVRDNLGRATTIQNILGTFAGQQFTFHQSFANPLLQWESYDNRLSHRYLWSDSVDELLADEQFLAGMTAPDTKWAMSDHQGTIKDIVDYNPATGVSTVERHRKYDPFGDRRSTAAPTDIVFGYTGKYFDDVTGLQNNWNRWYDPKQGRFISQDPIGFAGGDENLYRYVGNDVTNATDPTGLIIVIVHGIRSHNDDEINELTRRLNAHWDANGLVRQEVIHFRYGYGSDLSNFGFSNAAFDTWDDGNSKAGYELASLLQTHSIQRRILNSQEPINVLAYSNGSNLAWHAANQGTYDFEADRLLIIGGSLDNDNDMKRLATRFGRIVNFSSRWDKATWYVNGLGRFGFESGLDPMRFNQIWVSDVYHSLGEMQGVIGNVAEWRADQFLQGTTGKSGSFWLSPLMLRLYYWPYLMDSSDGRLSNFPGFETTDDQPFRQNVIVR